MFATSNGQCAVEQFTDRQKTVDGKNLAKRMRDAKSGRRLLAEKQTHLPKGTRNGRLSF